MAKHAIFAFVLISLVCSAFSAAPNISVYADEFEFIVGPSDQIGTMLYVEGTSYLNTSGNTVGSVAHLGNCTVTSGVEITENQQVWCLGSANAASGAFSFNQYNGSTLELVSVTPFTIQFNTSVLPSFRVVQDDDYLILVLQYNNPPVFEVRVFDTDTMAFVCTGLSADSGTVAGISFSGTYLIYSNIDNGDEKIHYVSCNGGTVVKTPVPDVSSGREIYAFNQSTVYANLVFAEKKEKIAAYLVAVSPSRTGAVSIGSRINITSFSVLNDTHFTASYVASNFYYIGLFTIDVNLNFVEVQAYNTQIPYNKETFVLVEALYTKNRATVSLFSIGDTSIATSFTYDFNRGIILPHGLFPRQQLANGSYVILNAFGFFTQSQFGRVNFTYAPNNVIYQDPADPSHLSAMYIPTSKSKINDKCVFTDIWPAQNIINVVTFPSCPIYSLSQVPLIKDVAYDASGNPHVAYRDSYTYLYIVSASGSQGPFTTISAYSFPAVNLNLTTGIGYFAGVQVTSVIIGSFYLNNGSVISKTTSVGETYNYVSKLNDDFFLTALSNSQATVIQVFNAQTGAKVSQQTVPSISLPLTLNNPVFPLGVNSSSSSVYSGVVLKTSTNYYLVNSAGQSTVISAQSPLGIVTLYPIGVDSFFAQATDGFLEGLVTYQVTSYSAEEEIAIEY